ncbi:YceD family protein [Roseomonas sp. BN140053]|uniref:YceD family protein n=1 Tax=Roseomonas sp. BN140053 TaxID=3391898 RepID=UPI0039E827A1
MTPELSRPIPLSAVPLGGRRETVVADAAERQAVAKRLDLLGLDRLEAELYLRPTTQDTVRVTGRLRASVVQACVVTLEPVPQEIEEAVDWIVAPPPDPESEEEELPDDALEGPEPVDAPNGVLDLGEAVTQQLSLALDPYPRCPGVALDPDGVGDPERNPFEGLAKLRRDG